MPPVRSADILSAGPLSTGYFNYSVSSANLHSFERMNELVRTSERTRSQSSFGFTCGLKSRKSFEHDSRAGTHQVFSAGGSPVPCGWEMECQGALQVLQVMSMACPNQAGSLQGSRGVNRDILAANDLGTGSGWQQSKQN